MIRCPTILAVALLSSGIASIASPGWGAANSSTLDILPEDSTGVSDSVDVGAVKPLGRANQEPGKTGPSGNPLWSVPISVLSATQERPIFSVSRRPPPRAVIAPPAEQAAVPPPTPTEPERPALVLIGAVVGDSDAIAVFLDRTSEKTLRLRQGDAHEGWQLISVQAREVALKKDDRTEVLILQRKESPTAAPAVSGGPAMPAPQPQPVSGGFDSSYAPYIPRSTPKNGESDGL